MADLIKQIIAAHADDPEFVKRFQADIAEMRRTDTAEQISWRVRSLFSSLPHEIRTAVREATVQVLKAYLKQYREMLAKLEMMNDPDAADWAVVVRAQIAYREEDLAKFDDDVRDERKREKTRERVKRYRERNRRA